MAPLSKDDLRAIRELGVTVDEKTKIGWPVLLALVMGAVSMAGIGQLARAASADVLSVKADNHLQDERLRLVETASAVNVSDHAQIKELLTQLRSEVAHINNKLDAKGH